MVGIRHGEGMLFIQKIDGELEPIGEIAEGMVIETVEDYSGAAIHQLATEAEATFTFDLTKQQMDNFLMEVFNIKKMALDMVRERGHGRIAHLATRARKRKTRKKNLHRAFRIPEKEEWQW